MRTAVIFLFALVAATPSHASKSCMTMAEARAQFATSHLFWHGSGHCWDATSPQHRIVRHVRKDRQQARSDSAAQDAEAQDNARDDDALPATREPKWRNAMSEMLPA